MTRTKYTKAHGSSIIGDVATESVTLNSKGGSLSAILKQGIRGELTAGALSYGAKIEFEPGVSCILVAPGQIKSDQQPGDERRFRVLKVSSGFVITLEKEGAGEVLDPTTKAIISVLDRMLEAGRVKLLSPDESERRLAGVLQQAHGLKAPEEPAQKGVRSPK
jgi:hypothetical protein